MVSGGLVRRCCGLVRRCGGLVRRCGGLVVSVPVSNCLSLVRISDRGASSQCGLRGERLHCNNNNKNVL